MVDLAISRALLKIADDFREFDPLISRISLVEDKTSGGTAWMTPSCRFGYNVEFFKKLSKDELYAVVLHEVKHYVYGHFSREKSLKIVKGEIHHEIANIAMDMEINQTIDHLPKEAVLPSKFKLPDGLTFEEYYAELIKNAKFVQGSSSSYMQGDVASDKSKGIKSGKADQGADNEGLDKEGVDTQQAILGEIESVAQSLGKSMTGYGTGLQKATVKYVPPVNLSAYIRNTYQNLSEKMSYGFDAYDYTKLARSMIPDILKFKEREFRPDIRIAFIVDTSGSRSSDQVSQSLSKIYSTVLGLDADDYTFDIFQVDTRVAKVTHVKSPSDLPREFTGGGGTCMYVAYSEFKIKYDLVVILTDGELYWEQEIENVPKQYKNKVVIGVDKYNYDETKKNSPFPVFIQ